MKTVKISTLKNNPNNPRTIRDEKFEDLKRSLKDFPKMMELRPIITDKDGIIIAGNMRFKAIEALGYTEIPGEWVKSANGLSKEQIDEFIIKDNLPFGEWDYDLLANEWNEDKLLEWGFHITGWDKVTPEAVDDGFQIPEDIETDIKLGDLFLIGEHRLLCGDSTNLKDVSRLMNNEKADTLLIDPPYNISFKSQRGGKAYGVHNDNMSDDKYREMLVKVQTNGAEFTEKTVATPGKQNLKMWFAAFEITDLAVWIAKNKMSGGRISNLSLWEPIVFIGKFDRGSRPTDLYEYSTKFQPEADGHPCPKTVDLFGEIISHYTTDSVLDLYIGSGTTMVAAHQLKRKCFGMDLDPTYCQIVLNRMRELDPGLTIKKV